MTIESALNAWLSSQFTVPAYWLERPEDAENAIVYRVISQGNIDGNLRATGIARDVYSISIYHRSADAGLDIANTLRDKLTDFNGDLSGYKVQLITFSGGRDLPLTGEAGQRQYLFVRDFIINH